MLLVFPQTRKAGITGSFLIDVAAGSFHQYEDPNMDPEKMQSFSLRPLKWCPRFFETLSPKPYNL